MRTRGLLGKTWVRACVFIPTSLIVFVGLFILCGINTEGGNRLLGDIFGYMDFATLLIALFVGPAWILQAFRVSTPPRNDGPPRGGVVPMPKRTPHGSGALDIVRDRSDRAARAALHRITSCVRLPGRRVASRTTA